MKHSIELHYILRTIIVYLCSGLFRSSLAVRGLQSDQVTLFLKNVFMHIVIVVFFAATISEIHHHAMEDILPVYYY